MNDKALTVVPDKTITAIGELSVQAVVDRKRKVVEVMNAVMRDGEHYGRIPGCGDKPTLFKAGAEILAMTFGLAPSFDVERIDLPGGHREYQVVCRLTHIASGVTVAAGVGCATTMESKHRWRGGAGRSCPECGTAAIIKGKAEFGGGWVCFGKRGGCGQTWKDGDQAIEGQSSKRTENTDPADQYNTVLKMGKKRAQVDATLTACGASDLLAQDLEDLPPGSENAEGRRPAAAARPTAKADRSTAAGDQPAVSHDELFAELGRCTTEPALKAVGKRIPYAKMEQVEREKFGKAYNDQLALIQRGAAAPAAPAGDKPAT